MAETTARRALADPATDAAPQSPTRRKATTGEARPRRRTRRGVLARDRPIEWEALLVVALIVAAILARWPYLLRLPHFTDEIGEIRWALGIYRGEHLPLTAQVQYFGPLHHYLVALVFRLIGPAIILPRLIIAAFGALTVGLTYLLGRELGGWRLGALGAALLATNAQHILVNSHVAWQNSTTPFYSTLAAYALLRALRTFPAPPAAPDRAHVPRWARWLLLCGFVGGLMLQTHIGTLVLAPAFALATLLHLWHTPERKAALRRFFISPWPYLAALLTVIAYSQVLIANARDNWIGFRRMQGRDYAYVKNPTIGDYLGNLRDLLFELVRMLSNPFRIPERPLHYLTSAPGVIVAALCLLGLVALARGRRWLPLLMLVSTALLMPRFNHAYGVDGDRPIVTGRYVAFLLPPLLIAVAAGALVISDWAARRLTALRQGLVARRALAVASLALIALLVLSPLLPLRRYYREESARDPANATFLATVRFVQEARGPRTPVLIDAFMDKIDLKDGAEALEILYILFSLEGIPYRIVGDPGAELARLGPTLDPADTEALPIIVMMYDRCYPLREQVPLQQISERYLLRELYPTKPSFYAVYRYAPPPQKAGCYPP